MAEPIPEGPIFCIACSHMGGPGGVDVSTFANPNNLIPNLIPTGLIVHRNIANQYWTDPSGFAALFNAVVTLNAPCVVIVGHTNCEAIQQSIDSINQSPIDQTPVDSWLLPLTCHAKKHGIADAGVLVEENVRLQIDNVMFDVPRARIWNDQNSKHWFSTAQIPIQKSPLVMGVLYNETTGEWSEVLPVN